MLRLPLGWGRGTRPHDDFVGQLWTVVLLLTVVSSSVSSCCLRLVCALSPHSPSPPLITLSRSPSRTRFVHAYAQSRYHRTQPTSVNIGIDLEHLSSFTSASLSVTLHTSVPSHPTCSFMTLTLILQPIAIQPRFFPRLCVLSVFKFVSERAKCGFRREKRD